MKIFYDFGKSLSDEMMRDMDYTVYEKKLTEYYNTTSVKDLEKLIRLTILDRTEFNNIINFLGVSKMEFYVFTNHISNKIYNKRIIRYIKAHYKNER